MLIAKFLLWERDSRTIEGEDLDGDRDMTVSDRCFAARENAAVTEVFGAVTDRVCLTPRFHPVIGTDPI